MADQKQFSVSGFGSKASNDVYSKAGKVHAAQTTCILAVREALSLYMQALLQHCDIPESKIPYRVADLLRDVLPEIPIAVVEEERKLDPQIAALAPAPQHHILKLEIIVDPPLDRLKVYDRGIISKDQLDNLNMIDVGRIQQDFERISGQVAELHNNCRIVCVRKE